MPFTERQLCTADQILTVGSINLKPKLNIARVLLPLLQTTGVTEDSTGAKGKDCLTWVKVKCESVTET